MEEEMEGIQNEHSDANAKMEQAQVRSFTECF